MPALRKLASGKWQASVRLPDGTRRTYSAPLKGEAREWGLYLEGRVRTGEWRNRKDDRITVGQWHARWKAARVVQPHTARVNEISHRRILNAWAKTPLRQVSHLEVQAWVKLMSEVGDTRSIRGKDVSGPLGPHAVREAFKLFRTMINAATDEGLATADSCRRITLPEAPPRLPRWFTHEQAGQLVDALTGSDRVMVEVMLWCGLRPGEAMGLRACDVLWIRRRLSIDGTARDDGTWKKYPKNAASVGEVPVPEQVMDSLSVVAAGMSGEDRLFRSPRGRNIIADNWRADIWHPAVQAAGVPKYSPNTCRHTCASWLVQDGVPLYDVSQLLRHANPVETARSYAHLAPDSYAAVTAAWDRIAAARLKLLTHG